jgi:uncharacterized surface protein with fasciclin (FAS1) repeats
MKRNMKFKFAASLIAATSILAACGSDAADTDAPSSAPAIDEPAGSDAAEPVATDAAEPEATDAAEPVATDAGEPAGTDPAEPAGTDAAGEPGTIVDVAVGAGTFNTLVAAVGAADLAETLSGEGPFTVFAPTDDAFAALPAGLVDALLLPENKEALTAILTYHVLAAEVPSSAVTAGPVATVQGEEIEISVEGGTVMVNDATVIAVDVEASNGVIHVIDQVLVPPSIDPAALLEG